LPRYFQQKSCTTGFMGKAADIKLGRRLRFGRSLTLPKNLTR
jgi:hypothetical protein